jgi:hypothetical protein
LVEAFEMRRVREDSSECLGVVDSGWREDLTSVYE